MHNHTLDILMNSTTIFGIFSRLNNDAGHEMSRLANDFYHVKDKADPNTLLALIA
jgi:hypothetical protein